MERIAVGISSCLLGNEVRHDGGHKRSRYCTDVLSEYFEYRPLCPEMGAGLGVPRPTVHLQESPAGLRLVQVRGDGDFTEAMQGWIDRTLPGLNGLRGFVLMAKSPSCGMERIRVYREDGEVLHRDGQGLFAAALTGRYPLLPVEEEGRLNDAGLRENFIERVFFFDDWSRMAESGITARGLIEFHTRHKFQILAHCQATYRRVGPLLADLKRQDLNVVADQYIREVMAAMSRQVSRGAHINSLQHLFGFYREQLSDVERASARETLEAYGRGELPLVVPMTMLRHLQRRFPSDYVGQQHYLAPYPDALGLRNRL